MRPITNPRNAQVGGPRTKPAFPAWLHPRYDGAVEAEGGPGSACVPQDRVVASGGFHDEEGWSREAQSGVGEESGHARLP